jgi:hypothetical protein
MLRVLSGTQHGFLGKLPLKPEFLAALGKAEPVALDAARADGAR